MSDLSPENAIMLAQFYALLNTRPKLLTRVAIEEEIFDDLVAALSSGNQGRISVEVERLTNVLDHAGIISRLTAGDGIPSIGETREQHLGNTVAKEAAETLQANAPMYRGNQPTDTAAKPAGTLDSGK